MKLDIRIQNFGKIKDANIKLRPFTVLAGPNSSGKSFISKALYSFFHELNADIIPSYLLQTILDSQYLTDKIVEDIPRPSADESLCLNEIRLNLEALGVKIQTSYRQITLSQEEELVAAMSPHVHLLMENITKLYKILSKKQRKLNSIEDFLNAISINIKSFEQFLENRMQLFAKELEKNLQNALKYNFQVNSLKQLINFDIQKEKNCACEFNLGSLGAIRLIDTQTKKIDFSFSPSSVENLQKLNNVVYIESPVYWKIKPFLTDKFIQFRFDRRNALTGIPKYFYDLENLLGKEIISNENDSLLKIANDIYEGINGRLEVSPTGEILFADNGYAGQKVNLHLTASGISNLGMIALLIEKGILSKGSYLFIDEPEVNLHPEWQVVMLKALFDLSKNNVNIVIASHSVDMMKSLEIIMENHDNAEYIENNIGINYLDCNGHSIDVGDNFQTLSQIKLDLMAPFDRMFISGKV